MNTVEAIKWLLYPGINLHARLRYRAIGREIRPPLNGTSGLVLDAGCGNGMLTYQAYLKGNRALGVSIKPGEIERNRRHFNEYLGISDDWLKFEVYNLYKVEDLGAGFDQIICSEVLEHITEDARVCQAFWKILKPGGILHLCCPNAEHPDNVVHELDHTESGGHVRPGYTEATFRSLLEPIGFEIIAVNGVGGPLRQSLNKLIRGCETVLGLGPAIGVFLMVNWLTFVDQRRPRVPYSIYVQAQKRSSQPASA